MTRRRQDEVVSLADPGAGVDLVGGKGARLAELAAIDGVRVPDGFCVTTAAFERVVAGAPGYEDLVCRLQAVDGDDERLLAAAAELRDLVESIPFPDDLAGDVAVRLERLGGDVPFAVRSSATTEDAATASFAGQHDSHLDVVGTDEVLRRVASCWASLHTDRAVAYRLRSGVEHRSARMAVVVQRMVPADAAGVLFTADPVTGHRSTAAIEAVPGLGEALVAGTVEPDRLTVRGSAVVESAVGAGRSTPVLTDLQAVALEDLGRRIEAHLGAPQDIEWCLAPDGFHVVQSRPITTLFPLPEVPGDDLAVYVSVGHQQMMTDAIRPLGRSVWKLTAGRPMYEAGSRLFVDVAAALATPAGRGALVAGLGRSDPLVAQALEAVVERLGLADGDGDASPPGPPPGGTGSQPEAPDPEAPDPAVVGELIALGEESVARAEQLAREGVDRDAFDVALEVLASLKATLFDARSLPAISAGIDASWWLDDHLSDWLGERGATDVLTRSAPGNPTSEMGLALLDVADVVRRHPEVVAHLRDDPGDDLLADLPGLPGGSECADAIRGFLDRYGARCTGEIDVTRPRWAEQPTALVPAILADVDGFEAGAARRLAEEGERAAREKEAEVLERLRSLPDGEHKAAEVKAKIDQMRAFIGYREHPKFVMVRHYHLVRQVLLEEVRRLVEAGVLGEVDDAWFLTFDELREVARSQQADPRLIERRRRGHAAHELLSPPRVMTSEGEVFTGEHRSEEAPAGALVGLAVSAGVVEGRARIVTDLADAAVEPGDVLVTVHTDPSWSPLFVAISGLVTEVGGRMTHGAVVAREYGLPAVVGVVDATRRIRDGQRVRVHGALGWVELLD